ncbi:MAG: hypothetical protein KDK55_04440 [Chlamydiia bacterium]|nr:hypothetical protein [Chlamydiia bacterium]
MKIFVFKIVLSLLSVSLFVFPDLIALSSLFPEIAQNNAQKKQTKQVIKWEIYRSEDNSFSVMMPVKPEHVEQSIDVPNTNLSIRYDTYVSEPSESVVYVVSVWHYPSEIDMSKPEINLQDGFSGMLSALPGSEVIKMEMGKVDGFDAIEFLVKNEDIYFQGKLILVHNTLYQVFTVYRDSIDMKKDYDEFMDSFSLLNTDQHKVVPKKASRRMNI